MDRSYFIPGEKYRYRQFPNEVIFIGWDNDKAVFKDSKVGYFNSIAYSDYKKVPKIQKVTKYVHWYYVRPKEVRCVIFEFACEPHQVPVYIHERATLIKVDKIECEVEV